MDKLSLTCAACTPQLDFDARMQNARAGSEFSDWWETGAATRVPVSICAGLAKQHLEGVWRELVRDRIQSQFISTSSDNQA